MKASFRLGLLALASATIAACGHAPAKLSTLPGSAPGNPLALGVPPAQDMPIGSPIAESPAPPAPPSPASAPTLPSAAPSAIAAASPGATPAAPAKLTGPLASVAHPEHLIAFATSRLSGGAGGFDVFVYDPDADAVLVPPGLNTPSDEIDPRVSPGGNALYYCSNAKGHFAVMRYSFATQKVDMPANLDTGQDCFMPSVSADGQTIAYLQRQSGGALALTLYDAQGQQAKVPATIQALGLGITQPQVAPDGQSVVFSAPNQDQGMDLYLFDREMGEAEDLAVFDSASDDLDPCFSADGRKLVFASNRNGSYQLFVGDLKAQSLVTVNIADGPGDCRHPHFLPDGGVIFDSDRSGAWLTYASHPGSSTLPTLATAHDPGEDAFLGSAAPPGENALPRFGGTPLGSGAVTPGLNGLVPAPVPTPGASKGSFGRLP